MLQSKQLVSITILEPEVAPVGVSEVRPSPLDFAQKENPLDIGCVLNAHTELFGAYLVASYSREFITSLGHSPCPFSLFALPVSQ